MLWAVLVGALGQINLPRLSRKEGFYLRHAVLFFFKHHGLTPCQFRRGRSVDNVFCYQFPLTWKVGGSLGVMFFVSLWGVKETFSEIERKDFISPSSRLVASGAHWFA